MILYTDAYDVCMSNFLLQVLKVHNWHCNDELCKFTADKVITGHLLHLECGDKQDRECVVE